MSGWSGSGKPCRFTSGAICRTVSLTAVPVKRFVPERRPRKVLVGRASRSDAGPDSTTRPPSRTATWSAIVQMSRSSWVTSSDVRPLRRAARAWRTSVATATSSPARGSSRSTTSGSVARARAMATRCACPPDRSCGRRDASSPHPTASSSARARLRAAAAVAPADRGPNATFASTSRWGNSAGRCVSRATRRWCTGTHVAPATSRSAIRTLPAVGRASPATRCSSDVLPAPFGPTTAVTLPSATSRARSTPRSISAARTLRLLMAGSRRRGRIGR